MFANVKFNHEQEIRRELYYNAPYAPFCSDDKTAGVKLPRREAFKRQYVQLNPPCNLKVFVIDIDHEDESLWNGEDVPTPNAIIRNKDNKRVHLLFRIDDILLKSEKQDVVVNDGPIQYAKAVYYGLCNKLKADRAAFNNVVSKNPFHSAYNSEFIHSRIYKLKDLAEYAEPDWSVYKWGDKENPNPESRNLSLFHKVRFIAYNSVHRYRLSSDMEGFYNAVLAECYAANTFKGKGFNNDENLPSNQIKAIAKSISTWTWNNYVGSNVNRGVMALPHHLDLKEKQQKAAEFTANKKSNRTLSALKAAVASLKNEKNKITQTNVKVLSGFSLSTVKRYWKQISGGNPVSLAVHKVSFVRESLKEVSDFTYKYELNPFRLHRFKKELNLKYVCGEIPCLFTSRYNYNHSVGRFIETGSDINIQTLKKDIRNELFKGWHVIDLAFSHGQMLNQLLSTYSDRLKSRFQSLDGHLMFFDAFSTYSHFIDNMDTYFNSWEVKTGLCAKTIKRALVALMNRAGNSKLNLLLNNKLSLLMSDAEFFEVFTVIKVAVKEIMDMGLKLRELELEVFRPYWGRGLIIHDAIMVNDEDLAKSIMKEIPFELAWKRL